MRRGRRRIFPAAIRIPFSDAERELFGRVMRELRGAIAPVELLRLLAFQEAEDIPNGGLRSLIEDSDVEMVIDESSDEGGDSDGES